MDSLDNLDIFCPYDLCCSFSIHEKSTHNTILDRFGHAYLCDSHMSQKLQHKHTFFVKCAAQVYHRKHGRTDRRTDRRTNRPKPICHPNFFEVGGIKTLICAFIFWHIQKKVFSQHVSYHLTRYNQTSLGMDLTEEWVFSELV